jgi:hypothetical protein
MVIYPEKLNTMTDDEIDVAVAQKLIELGWYLGFSSFSDFIGYSISFCNNYENVMLLAQKFAINIRWILNTDHATVGGYEIEAEDSIAVGGYIESDMSKDPRRAIAEVFLMMEID